MKKIALLFLATYLVSTSANSQTLPKPQIVSGPGYYYQNYQFISSKGCVTTTFYVGDTIFNTNTFISGGACTSPINATSNKLAVMPTEAIQLVAGTNLSNYWDYVIQNGVASSSSKSCQRIGPNIYLWGKYQVHKINTPGVYRIGFLNDATTVDITVVNRPAISPNVSISSNAINNTSVAGEPVSFTATVTTLGTYSLSRYRWFVNNILVGTNNNIYNTSSLQNNDVVKCIIGSTLDNCSDIIYDTSQSITMGVTVLPVKLSNYEVALTNNNKVRNHWTTAAELNSKNFEIQRSVNGSNFETIGTVAAKGFANEYSFVDDKPFVGFNYYRLKMIDNDGTFTYSKVKQIVNATSQIAVNIYPNPAKNVVTITSTSNGTIVITNTLGKQVKVNKVNVGNNTIDISNLSKGTYFVSIVSNQGISNTQKLTIKQE